MCVCVCVWMDGLIVIVGVYLVSTPVSTPRSTPVVTKGSAKVMFRNRMKVLDYHHFCFYVAQA